MRFFIALLLLLLLSSFVLCEDFYQILGVSRSANKKQLRRAYREMSLKYHPDKHESFDKSVEDHWMKIQKAYEVLSDDELRKVYDRQGEAGLDRHQQQQQQGGGGGNPFTNPFDFFRGNQRRQEEERKVPDVTVPLFVTLEQLYTGHSLKATINRQVICTQCSGSGARSPGDIDKCSHCNGQGVRVVKQQLGPGFFTQSQMPCDRCGGKGTSIKRKCPKCKGKKVHAAEDTVTIEIEPGMKDGDVVTMFGYSDEHPDLQTGDVKFVINTIKTKGWDRQGNHLYTTLHISLVESLVGFKKSITALDGRDIPIVRSRVTSPGQVLVVKGEGMTSGFNSDGDLFVTVTVDFPKEVSDIKDRELLKQVLEKYL
ncbi:hypothetical protein GEMRC1_013667 [Eukaryota sp. GEM-RC1]